MVNKILNKLSLRNSHDYSAIRKAHSYSVARNTYLERCQELFIAEQDMSPQIRWISFAQGWQFWKDVKNFL